jgi:CheY-like chemotaxis protein
MPFEATPANGTLAVPGKLKKEIHILMLEDNPTDSELAGHTLRRGGVKFTATRVETEEDFIRELEKNPPDLILSDYALPGFDGYAALDIAKRKAPHIPFIFVTGTMGEEVAIETLKSGATDYVLKHRLARLVPSVHRALREATERDERRRAQEQLRESHEQLRALSVYLQHVREEERTRIAREVHDELGQALTSCKLDLSLLANKLPGNLAPLKERAKALSAHIDATIHTVRRIATELRPGILDHLGLIAALEWQANEFQTRTGIKCDVRTDLLPDFPGDADQHHSPCRRDARDGPFERSGWTDYSGSERQWARDFAGRNFEYAIHGFAGHERARRAAGGHVQNQPGSGRQGNACECFDSASAIERRKT